MMMMIWRKVVKLQGQATIIPVAFSYSEEVRRLLRGPEGELSESMLV